MEFSSHTHSCMHATGEHDTLEKNLEVSYVFLTVELEGEIYLLVGNLKREWLFEK